MMARVWCLCQNIIEGIMIFILILLYMQVNNMKDGSDLKNFDMLLDLLEQCGADIPIEIS